MVWRALRFPSTNLQKRIHFVEEKVGFSQMRGIPELLGAEMSE